MTLASAPQIPPSPSPPAPPASREVVHVAQAGAVSQWQLIQRRFARHKLARTSFYLLILLYLMAIFADFLAPCDPQRRDLSHPFCPPQLLKWSMGEGFYTNPLVLQIDPVTFRRTYYIDVAAAVPLRFWARCDPYIFCGILPLEHRLLGVNLNRLPQDLPEQEATYYALGTDRYGHDVLSRILHGARVSLSVGLVGIAVTFVLGMLIGGVSGYVGGRVDNVVQRAIEIVNAFPQLPLWMALGALLPGDWSPLKVYFAITVVLSLLGWTGLARVVRGKILTLREEDYATAARLLGAGHARILFRHLLPGFASHIIVALTLSVPGMILGETSLSFLGLGLRPPIVSWGVMLQDCMDVQAVRFYPWLFAPVVFIVVTVLCFNFLGDGLRDAADPYANN